jgi:hypothetical protein
MPAPVWPTPSANVFLPFFGAIATGQNLSEAAKNSARHRLDAAATRKITDRSSINL